MITNSTSRFTLTQIFLDRTRMDEVTTTYMVKAGGYRYGFNGMEKDDEVSGAGNSYTAEFWQYSPRLGRRWEIDPMTGKYPWQSPYSTFNNNPIFYVDPLGLEGEEPTAADKEKGTWQGPSGKTYNYDKDADMWYKPEDEVTITAEKKSMVSQLFTDIGRAIGIGYTTAGQPKTGGKGSEWLGNMTLGNHFGNGPSIGREGKGRFYTDKNSSHYDSWMKGRANHAALENFMAGYMGGSLTAPFVIAGAITTAPVWSPYLAMGANYTMQAARAYHTTFGKTGGYLNIGANYFTQSFATGSMNPLDHNVFEYGASAVVGKFSIQNQVFIGAGGGLINWTPSEGKVKHLFNQNAGITLGNVVNGGIAPLYNLTGPVNGFIFGNIQQAVGGREMNNLEKQLGDLNSK